MDDTTNDKPRPSTWERSTTRRFLRWLLSGKTLRRGLISLAWIATLTALFYGFVDWRARRAWNAYRHDYEARNGPLALEAFVPKVIPDESNFASTPFAREWVQTQNNTNFLFSKDTYGKGDFQPWDKKKVPKKYTKCFEDLVAWEQVYQTVQSGKALPKGGVPPGPLDLASRRKAAIGVLKGMQEDAKALEELRQASSRPLARYALTYKMDDPASILLPHLICVKEAGGRLQTRACAELALGQSDKALEDVMLSLYLADTLKNEPFLISYLVRVAEIEIALRPIWEGLAEHQWTDPQLQVLQQRMEGYNMIGDLEQALRAERAFGVRMMDLVKERGLAWFTRIGDTPNLPAPQGLEEFMQNLVSFFIPAGWYDQEKLHYCQGFDQLFQGTMDAKGRQVFPQQVKENNEPWQNSSNSLRNALWDHNMISKFFLPSLGKLPVQAAAAQTVSQAAIACALERFRISQGHYPETLQELTNSYMPNMPRDVIGGQPYHYRTLEGGRFILYSVGWNEKDDGGVSGARQYDRTEGDWVWTYPAESASREAAAR
ncbi:MAG: hypothetical protein ACLQVY_27900 [Limisphaerales bacterium]